MKGKFSIEELKEQGKAIATHNGVSKLFATADGQFFLESGKNAAEFHAKKNGLTLHTLDYEVQNTEPEAEKPVKKTLEDRIEAVQLSGDIATIEILLKGEKSKQVQEAATVRIEEIKAAENADERQ